MGIQQRIEDIITTDTPTSIGQSVISGANATVDYVRWQSIIGIIGGLIIVAICSFFGYLGYKEATSKDELVDTNPIIVIPGACAAVIAVILLCAVFSDIPKAINPQGAIIYEAVKGR